MEFQTTELGHWNSGLVAFVFIAMKRSINQVVVLTTVVIMGASLGAHGQNAEIEELRSAVKSMQETINSLSTNLANANARLAEMKNQPKPPQPTQPAAVAPGVPPSTQTGVSPDLKPESSKSGLADATTPIPFRDTISEDNLGATRPGNAPLD